MTQDFERTWQYKFQQSMLCRIDTEITKQILDGAEHLSDQSSRAHVIEWSQCAITRLEGVLPVGSAQEVFIECACHYPHEALQSLRDAYLQGGDIPQIQSMLLEIFREFLEDDLKLEMDEIETVFENGWGLAGLLEGDTILATKIPKSNMLRDYLIEDDPQLRREIYCHCPRVRDAVKLGKTVSRTYCYCGAGFYKNIWETILGQPVQVEVRSSVLHGDDVCTVAISLPI